VRRNKRKNQREGKIIANNNPPYGRCSDAEVDMPDLVKEQEQHKQIVETVSAELLKNVAAVSHYTSWPNPNNNYNGGLQHALSFLIRIIQNTCGTSMPN
jgi:hypothetical protein